MKAIITKYHPCTNTRGSRISASDSDGNRISISYPHELSGEDCYRAAAIALCKKMNWSTALVGGGTKDGYVFCFCLLAEEVLKWARTPGNHGGNPYAHQFVQDALVIAEVTKEAQS